MDIPSRPFYHDTWQEFCRTIERLYAETIEIKDDWYVYCLEYFPCDNDNNAYFAHIINDNGKKRDTVYVSVMEDKITLANGISSHRNSTEVWREESDDDLKKVFGDYDGDHTGQLLP